MDLWRRPRRLTYRQIVARMRFLPEDSATETVLRGRPAWTIDHALLDALRMHIDASRGVPVKEIKPSPLSPAAEPKTMAPEKVAALERVKARAAEHDARWALKEVDD